MAAVSHDALDGRTTTNNTARGFERALTTHEAAELLQIHAKTLQKMARNGRVPAFRIGHVWRFRASALDEWVRNALTSQSPLVP